jgi:hypothetical protein
LGKKFETAGKKNANVYAGNLGEISEAKSGIQKKNHILLLFHAVSIVRRRAAQPVNPPIRTPS